MPDKKLNGKTIVITGASSGIGRGAALAFAYEGASVVLAARRTSVLHEVADECQSIGGRAIAVPTDVSNPDDVEQLALAAGAEFGPVDVWVNDAGVGVLGRFEEIPLIEHTRVVETNLLGVMYGSYFALQLFRDRGHGTLINVASALGRVAAPYYASYTASKHGVVGLGAALRQELAENGEKQIHVCTVMPMAMDTPLYEHLGNYTGHEARPIPPLYHADKVVRAICRLIHKPKAETIVGRAGKAMVGMHRVARRPVERVMARHTGRTMIDKSPAAPLTPGNVRQPVARGTGVRSPSLRKRNRKAKA